MLLIDYSANANSSDILRESITRISNGAFVALDKLDASDTLKATEFDFDTQT